jgi:hypothetical protein
MYISDPPIFADIGDFDLNINSTAFMTNFTTEMNSSDVLQVDILNYSLQIDPFGVNFDGVSDMSDVFSRFFTFGGNVIRDRAVSISNYIKP